MKVTFDGGWSATVTDEPLDLTPRFLGGSVIVFPDGDNETREKFLLATFGSQEWLWDSPDYFRFDRESRNLVGAHFAWPEECASAEESARISSLPLVRPGGLRADEVEDFRHERCTVLCRAPGDAVLTCLRDLDVLDAPLEARIGIAPDVALLVQRGGVVGWSLTDSVRYLAVGFGPAGPAPPAAATRRLFTECLDLVTDPLIDEVQHRNPTVLRRLRRLHEALHAQRHDRHRIDALLALINDLVEDYADRPTGQQPGTTCLFRPAHGT